MKWFVLVVGLTAAGIIGLYTVPSLLLTTYQTETSDNVTICYTVYQPVHADEAPVVIMGHGIMVNKEMMTCFAVELAARGYIVANIDWRGHGQSTGFLTRDDLYKDLEAVIADIPLHTKADMSNIALLGYSMGGFPTYRYAVDHTTVKAWVGVGTAADGNISSTTIPKNVLMVIATYDEAFSPEEAKVSMGSLTGNPLHTIEFEKVYGSIENGTARKIHVVPGADHLTTPWNADFVFNVASWIDNTFDNNPEAHTTFYPRVFFLYLGIIGLIGLLAVVSPFLAETLSIKRITQSIYTEQSVHTFIGKYYLITLAAIPLMVVFVPLFFTPLPFTAFLTTLTGGLGIGLLIYCWRLAKKGNTSLTQLIKTQVRQPVNVWVFSAVVTGVFVVCYYFLIGLHFLGMIPSTPKIPYLFLYILVLFGTFFSYSLFIQKVSVPFLKEKLKTRHSITFVITGIINFFLIYSWFVIVILIPCIIVGDYFFAMILILMLPIFLFLTFLSVYMEEITGSIIPNAVIQSVWLGFVTTTLTPYVQVMG